MVHGALHGARCMEHGAVRGAWSASHKPCTDTTRGPQLRGHAARMLPAPHEATALAASHAAAAARPQVDAATAGVAAGAVAGGGGAASVRRCHVFWAWVRRGCELEHGGFGRAVRWGREALIGELWSSSTVGACHRLLKGCSCPMPSDTDHPPSHPRHPFQNKLQPTGQAGRQAGAGGQKSPAAG
eukprot:366432-Chlamydomonas_euryale.AAC.5